MADVTTYDGVINAISLENIAELSHYSNPPNPTGALSGTAVHITRSMGLMSALPSLPAGITKYRALSAALAASANNTFMLAKAVLLGSLNISSNAFTPGSTMPVRQELGNASQQSWGPLLVEVATVLSATPGSVSITYTNDAGGSSGSGTLALTGAATLGMGGMVFLPAPDLGASAVTAASRSGGSTPTGVLNFYGLLPLAMITPNAASLEGGVNLLTQVFNFLELGAGDTLKMLLLTATGTATAEYGRVWLMGES